MTPASEQSVSPEKIMQYAWTYAPPLIIEAAIRNHVFEVLESGPKTLSETSAATGASQRGLASILNALTGLEILTRDDADRYALTAATATFLLSGKPAYLGGFSPTSVNSWFPDGWNWTRLSAPAALFSAP